MLDVLIKTINANSANQYFILMLSELNNFQILPYAPHFKTHAGAVRYAVKHGYNIIK